MDAVNHYFDFSGVTGSGNGSLITTCSLVGDVTIESTYAISLIPASTSILNLQMELDNIDLSNSESSFSFIQEYLSASSQI